MSGEDERHDARVAANQRRLADDLRGAYDFVVCGAGSSGCVVARRLADDPSVTVLLLEAGVDDEAPEVLDPERWVGNLGGQRDWNFAAEPSPAVNGRRVPMDMGRTLGGGSSINVLVWSRGHRADWDGFAAETGDDRWSYAGALEAYRRIEDVEGTADETRRGRHGPMSIRAPVEPQPINAALLEGASEIGIPVHGSPNGSMMEAAQGCAPTELIIRNGARRSVYRSYVHPVADRPNLTVLTDALATRVLTDGRRAVGVEILHRGRVRRIGAGSEVILSAGAVNTPRILMRSGFGDAAELEGLGIPVTWHCPEVGRNLQDHVAFGVIWSLADEPVRPTMLGEAVVFGRTSQARDAPDVMIYPMMVPFGSAENMKAFAPADRSWTMVASVLHPRSRGRIRLGGPAWDDPIRIEANYLAHPDDVKAAVEAVELCRAIGATRSVGRVTRGEIVPGGLRGAELERYVRDDCTNYRHQACTARMGRDAESVVDPELRVRGIEGLRIADASVLPRVTTGNTMAPCVVVGERAADLIGAAHALVRPAGIR